MSRATAWDVFAWLLVLAVITLLVRPSSPAATIVHEAAGAFISTLSLTAYGGASGTT